MYTDAGLDQRLEAVNLLEQTVPITNSITVQFLGFECEETSDRSRHHSQTEEPQEVTTLAEFATYTRLLPQFISANRK